MVPCRSCRLDLSLPILTWINYSNICKTCGHHSICSCFDWNECLCWCCFWNHGNSTVLSLCLFWYHVEPISSKTLFLAIVMAVRYGKCPRNTLWTSLWSWATGYAWGLRERSWLILNIAAIPILFLYIFAEPIMKLIGQTPEISKWVGIFSLWIIGWSQNFLLMRSIFPFKSSYNLRAR